MTAPSTLLYVPPASPAGTVELDAVTAALALALDLISHGVPVVVCTPNYAWSPAAPAGTPELIWPRGWSTITAEESRAQLATFRPGVDTLAMVSGHGVDVVDVDPKAGGSVDNLPAFRFYGVHTTPSGGRHYLVPSTGFAKMTLTTTAGHVGDYLGGTVEGASRALAYLPGSSRPKYPGRVYRIEQQVDLDLLLDEDPDDELVAALEGAGGRRTGSPAKPAVTTTEVDAFRRLHAQATTSPFMPVGCSYGQTAVRKLLAGMEAAVPGDQVHGRHATAQKAVIRVVELMRAGCATTADLDGIRAKLTQIKPEGDNFDDMVAWALANADGGTGCAVHGAGGAVAAPTAAPAPAAADLWDARPVLRHLHHFARARGVAPLAVLGVALARVVAATPVGYLLPPLVGGPGSLNLFVALVGPSGAGKGAARAAAEDALDLAGWRDGLDGSTVLHTPDVGSGEGVVHQYARWQKKDGQEGVAQVRESVLFDVPEIDQATAVSSRQGSTLMPVLRKAWSGEALSFAYADPTKRLHVRAHSYRMALTAGVQPGRAGALLDDADGGTPQRFLWMPVTDPDMPRERPAEPQPWTVPLPGRQATGRAVVFVCAEARDAITEAHWRRSRGEGNALDGHALYAQLKVAAALADLDGHLGAAGVTVEDWQLAGLLMDVSDATRTGVQAELRRSATEANKARAEADAVREIVKTETVEAAAVQRASKAAMTVLGKQPGEWMTGAELRRAVHNRVRPHLDAALDGLVLAGSIEIDEIDHHGQPGRRYRCRP
ncbi:hypothetical protein [Modestobacter marinus]|uniref:hypothetical protein n=1 Tax=Modestobacter marinus TaxID=477641 RepID=UPI001C944227|nr:hypothetical protein [Modestobacter marinus]